MKRFIKSKKKNAKGITLVELLVVLVILALLILLIGSTIVRLIDRSELVMTQVQEDELLSAAERWMVANMDLFDDDDGQVETFGLDIVFIIDVSGSMMWSLFHDRAPATNATPPEQAHMINTRVWATMEAMNIALETICGSDYNCQHTPHRVSYVYYGAGITRSSALSHTTQRITLVNGEASTTPLAPTASSGTNTFFRFAPGTTGTARVNGSTNIQAGITTATNILRSSNMTTQRIPVIILMTDGEANFSRNMGCTRPLTIANCSTPWTVGGENNATATTAIRTMQSGVLARQAIQATYEGRGFIYSVVLSQREPWTRFVLNPSRESFMALTGGGAALNNNVRSETLSFWGLSSNADYTGQFQYVDRAFTALNIDELRNAFNIIAQEIREATQFKGMCVTVERILQDGFIPADLKLPNNSKDNDVIWIGQNVEFNQWTHRLITNFWALPVDRQNEYCPIVLEA